MPGKKQPLHERPKLCRHILRGVENSSVSLEIAASSIPNAGSGLFVVNDVQAGDEIFRSQPLVVVCEGNDVHVCDYCFANPTATVHPEGRFYADGEERVKLLACTGCKNVKYCSKECQSKAWGSYHKHECSIVKELLENQKIMGAVPHALARLLLWVKDKTMSKEDLRTIISLQQHNEERANRWLSTMENDKDAILEPTLAVAYQVMKTVDSGLGLRQVHEMACMLQHNGAAICPAEAIEQHGTFLDLVVSTINHCCAPNAHTFFEGRELRCRALKDIPAGTEITVHYYPTPRFDVLLRRAILDQHMCIKCNCQLCRSETGAHLAEAPGRQNHLGLVKEAQDKLDKLGKDAALVFSKYQCTKTCSVFQKQVLEFAVEGYPSGCWPDHMEPLPQIMRQLGGMYRDLGYVIGLEFQLKGTLHVRDKTDPSWMVDLHSLTKFIIFIAQAGHDDIKWVTTEDKPVLERSDMRYVARGYLLILCLGARSAFGMDSKFVQALYRWTGDLIEYGDDAKVQTDSFREAFEVAQKRLIVWATADVVDALQLPSREQIIELEKDIKVLGPASLVQALGEMDLNRMTSDQV